MQVNGIIRALDDNLATCSHDQSPNEALFVNSNTVFNIFKIFKIVKTIYQGWHRIDDYILNKLVGKITVGLESSWQTG